MEKQVGQRCGESVGEAMESISSDGEDSMDGNLQEEGGIVPQIDGSFVSLVLAEGFPSWSFVLKSLGCTEIHTVTKGLTLEEKDEMVAAGVPGETTSWNNLKQVCKSLSGRPNVFVWVQGSESFINKTIKLRKHYSFTNITCCVSSSATGSELVNEDGLVWRYLKHASLGGLTTGRWRCATSCVLDMSEFRRKVTVRPKLGKILRPTEGGKLLTEEEKQGLLKTGKFLTDGSLVPPGVDELELISKTVYDQVKLARRGIAEAEMMDVYDMDVKVQKRIIAGLEYGPVSSRAYVKQPPGKVLYRLALSSLAGRRRETKVTPTSDKLLTDMKDSELGLFPAQEVRALEKETTDSVQERISADGQNMKAAKNDDASVPVGEWNKKAASLAEGGYHPEKHDKALDSIRGFMLRWWKRRLKRSFEFYLKRTYGNWPLMLDVNRKRSRDEQEGKAPCWGSRSELKKDLVVGKDAIDRAWKSSWWEWDAGSTVFFWRWTNEYKKMVRDGLRVYVKGELPQYHAQQRWPKEEDKREKLKKKVAKPVLRGYISDGYVKSLTGFFQVPKGEDDIRVVYDASKSGLNDALWAPNFFLPTVDTVLRSSGLTTFYGDIDLGEMFLNYFLDEKLRPYAGVDLTEVAHLIGKEVPPGGRLWMSWNRTLMGLGPSPFLCIRMFKWSEDFIRGDRHDVNNPLRWDKVVLNSPGQVDYDPRLPWIYRYDSIGKCIAAFFETYVDDVRTGAATEEFAELTTHAVASRINYLGQQDSPRKRRRVSSKPGAWSGAVIVSEKEENLFVTCSMEKWLKTKSIVEGIDKELREGGDTVTLDRKQLERDRGFLVHISRTFTQAVPYLKGIHHTLESWRMGRDKDGWKFNSEEMVEWLQDEYNTGSELYRKEEISKKNWKEALKSHRSSHEGEAPVRVTPVERLYLDVAALCAMFQSQTPERRLVRGISIFKINLIFGDASGAGFGSSWQVGCEIHYRFGLWGKDMDLSSSNLRELKNLVDTLLKMEAEGILKGVEIFVFTDNSTAERAFFKGSSKSRLLHDLVLELRLLETRAGIKVHFIHVAGTRMIDQGSDGLSRGNLTEGVMGGKSMEFFVPIHLGAIERSPEILPWIKSWAKTEVKSDWLLLSPEHWFDRGHDFWEGGKNSDGMWIPTYKKGNFIWSPPPTLAETALEQLRQARHKRQTSTHIFVCPRLMEPYWSRHLTRSADFVFVVPAGSSFWKQEMHEPLIVGIYLPFLSFSPWQWKGQPALLGLDRELRKVWKEDQCAGGRLLHKFWSEQKRVPSMSPKLASTLLSSKFGFSLSHRKAGKRCRTCVEEEGGRRKVSKR